uniref:hypothetical protein n=1 Tax=Nonomuraea rhizosphaerae TaxID=2665663 RepID=UPI001C5E9157
MRSLAIAGGLVVAGALAVTAFAVYAPPQETAQPATATAVTETLQARLKRLPNDYRGWAQLGTQYVDQARITGDPSYYTKAEGALATATRLNAADDTVLTGQAALAAGRHD